MKINPQKPPSSPTITDQHVPVPKKNAWQTFLDGASAAVKSSVDWLKSINFHKIPADFSAFVDRIRRSFSRHKENTGNARTHIAGALPTRESPEPISSIHKHSRPLAMRQDNLANQTDLPPKPGINFNDDKNIDAFIDEVTITANAAPEASKKPVFLEIKIERHSALLLSESKKRGEEFKGLIERFGTVSRVDLPETIPGNKEHIYEESDTSENKKNREWLNKQWHDSGQRGRMQRLATLAHAMSANFLKNKPFEERLRIVVEDFEAVYKQSIDARNNNQFTL